MRYFITGSAGFIGQNLIKNIGMANVCAGYDIADSPVENLYNVDHLRHAMETFRPDAVVHLAAETSVPGSFGNPALHIENNYIGTQNVFFTAQSAGVKQFVFASSCAAEKMGSPYAVSKAAAEQFLESEMRGYKSLGVPEFRYNILRFANVYGPGSDKKSSVIARFCREVLESNSVTINGEGSQMRDFVHVDDVCRAIMHVTKEICPPGPHYVGTNQMTSINELVRLLEDARGNQDVLDPPIVVKRGPEDVADGIPHIDCPTVPGWEAKTRLESGLVSTYNYFYQKAVSERRDCTVM